MEHLLGPPMCLYNILLTSNYGQSIMMIRSDLMVVLGLMKCFLWLCHGCWIIAAGFIWTACTGSNDPVRIFCENNL